MNVWLIQPSEPLPSDPGSPRPFKTGMLAEHLAQKGHLVTWWIATFDHYQKRQRRPQDYLPASPGYSVRPIWTSSYVRNVSLIRMWTHVQFAWRFFVAAMHAERPDVIVASMPTPEATLAAGLVGRLRGVPVVADVRDLWPDAFQESGSFGRRLLLHLLLIPMMAMVIASLRSVTAISANTDGYLAWAKRRGGDKPSTLFPIGYRANRASIARDPQVLRVCFFGTFSAHFDFVTVIEAARLLHARGAPVEFVLCGVGDLLGEVRTMSQGLSNVSLPGWLGTADIQDLMARSHVGIAPYVNTSNFTLNMPNKPIEYMSSGLPIVSCLGGILAQAISTHGVGFAYTPGDASELADLLETLMADRHRLEQAAAAARTLFAREYEHEVVAERYEGFLKKLLK